jgi:hypothetical protein
MRPPLFARPLVGRADDVDALELAGLEEPLGELVEFSAVSSRVSAPAYAAATRRSTSPL